MSKVLVNESSLQDIADAIREMNGTNNTYIPSVMGAGIRAIKTGLQMAMGTTTGTTITITGLGFKPSIVFLMYGGSSGCGSVRSVYGWIYDGVLSLYGRNSGGAVAPLTEGSYSISGNGFTITTPSEFPGSTVWFAFG